MSCCLAAAVAAVEEPVLLLLLMITPRYYNHCCSNPTSIPDISGHVLLYYYTLRASGLQYRYLQVVYPRTASREKWASECDAALDINKESDIRRRVE